jgi:hypothetical protein
MFPQLWQELVKLSPKKYDDSYSHISSVLVNVSTEQRKNTTNREERFVVFVFGYFGSLLDTHCKSHVFLFDLGGTIRHAVVRSKPRVSFGLTSKYVYQTCEWFKMGTSWALCQLTKRG